jgi:3-hydroxyisobutyrate dehydrogenase
MSNTTTAVIGLGAMGLGMARSALRAGLATTGCDLRAEAREAFTADGGRACATPAEAAAGCDALAVVVVNAAQSESVLFGPEGALETLPEGAVVLGCATVPPAFARELGARLAERGVLFLDAPISGGAVKAASGELSVMASGSPEAFAAARPLLDAVATTVHELGPEPGQGSTMKMVNQCLAGVHIATAMEALALGIRSGLDPRSVYEVITGAAGNSWMFVYEVITGAAGNSWMFENRVPHVLDGDYAPRSAVDIFVKDLGIVLDAGRASGFPLPVTAAAHQQFLAASGMGLGGADDAAVVKVYQALSGIELPGDGEA